MDNISKFLGPLIELLKKRETWLFVAGLVAGALIVSYSYFWLQKPSFLIDPVISRAAEATVAARHLPPLPTYTPFPTYTPNPTSTCADYGIKVTSPTSGASVGGQFPVSGSFTSKPPEGSLLIIVKSLDSSDYWPSSTPVQINEVSRTWSGEASIFGNPPVRQEIIAMVVGKSGRALYDYYLKVGNKTQDWESINALTDDAMECDRIVVEKTK